MKQQKADYDTETAAHPERYGPTPGSNVMYMTNVAALPDDEMQSLIGYISHLIETGEAESFRFASANGDQTTTSIHQYPFWLQQQSQGLSNDGTCSPGMFK